NGVAAFSTSSALPNPGTIWDASHTATTVSGSNGSARPRGTPTQRAVWRAALAYGSGCASCRQRCGSFAHVISDGQTRTATPPGMGAGSRAAGRLRGGPRQRGGADGGAASTAE